jgi:hypothetical protein
LYSNDDSVYKSKEADCSSMNLKHSYDKKLGVAVDLNVIETESDTNTETHEEKAKIPHMYTIMSSD